MGIKALLVGCGLLFGRASTMPVTEHTAKGHNQILRSNFLEGSGELAVKFDNIPKHMQAETLKYNSSWFVSSDYGDLYQPKAQYTTEYGIIALVKGYFDSYNHEIFHQVNTTKEKLKSSYDYLCERVKNLGLEKEMQSTVPFEVCTEESQEEANDQSVPASAGQCPLSYCLLSEAEAADHYLDLTMMGTIVEPMHN